MRRQPVGPGLPGKPGYQRIVAEPGPEQAVVLDARGHGGLGVLGKVLCGSDRPAGSDRVEGDLMGKHAAQFGPAGHCGYREASALICSTASLKPPLVSEDPATL